MSGVSFGEATRWSLHHNCSALAHSIGAMHVCMNQKQDICPSLDKAYSEKTATVAHKGVAANKFPKFVREGIKTWVTRRPVSCVNSAKK